MIMMEMSSSGMVITGFKNQKSLDLIQPNKRYFSNLRKHKNKIWIIIPKVDKSLSIIYL